jgi:hypothetical protein
MAESATLPGTGRPSLPPVSFAGLAPEPLAELRRREKPAVIRGGRVLIVRDELRERGGVRQLEGAARTRCARSRARTEVTGLDDERRDR